MPNCQTRLCDQQNLRAVCPKMSIIGERGKLLPGNTLAALQFPAGWMVGVLNMCKSLATVDRCKDCTPLPPGVGGEYLFAPIRCETLARNRRTCDILIGYDQQSAPVHVGGHGRAHFASASHYLVQLLWTTFKKPNKTMKPVKWTFPCTFYIYKWFRGGKKGIKNYWTNWCQLKSGKSTLSPSNENDDRYVEAELLFCTKSISNAHVVFANSSPK